jgi:AcrR family transcriptional regulator
MPALRERILEAAIQVLAESGSPGFTQPRVAKAAGVSQSHLTYYFHTRSDLIEATAREAEKRLYAAYDAVIARVDGPASFAEAMGHVLRRAEGARVLLTLLVEADREPRVREVFREITREIRVRLGRGLEACGIAPDPDATALLHGLNMGLAALYLARNEEAAARETTACVALALSALAARDREATPP